MTNRGSALVLVLILTGLFAAIASLNIFITGLRAQEVRFAEQALEATNEAVSKAHLLRGHIVAKLKHELPSLVEARVRTDQPHYLDGQETALAQALQSLADSLYCNEIDDNTLVVAFTDTACGEPVPPEVAANYEVQNLKPYLIQGPPNRSLGGFFSFVRAYYPQSYAIPFVAFVKGEKNGARATAAFSGTFEVDLGPDNYRGFGLVVNHPPAVGQVSFSPNEWHEGPVMVDGPVAFNGAAKVLGRLYVIDNPDGKATFGPLTVPENEMVPSSQSPCYPDGCPKLIAGVDWSSSHPRLDLSATPLRSGDTLSIDGDVADFALEKRPSHTVLHITPSGGSKVLYRYKDGSRVLEKSEDDGASWTTVTNNFSGLVEVSGRILALHGHDAYNPSVAGDLTIRAEQLRITGPIYYNTSPCTKVRDGDEFVSQCDPTTGDTLTLIARTGDITIAIPGGQAWIITAHLVAPSGTIRVPASQVPPASLELLGTLAMDRWSPWGYDDANHRRVSGVVLRHYFDSRYYLGASYALSGLAQIRVYGVIPRTESPHIVRQ